MNTHNHSLSQYSDFSDCLASQKMGPELLSILSPFKSFLLLAIQS